MFAVHPVCVLHGTGCVKMTQPTAMVTSFLAWSLLAFPQGYTDAQTKDDAMFQVRWGAEYLLKLFQPAARAADGYTLIYQVGNWSLESQYWGTYEPLTAASMPRPGYNISTGAGKWFQSCTAACVFGQAYTLLHVLQIRMGFSKLVLVTDLCIQCSKGSTCFDMCKSLHRCLILKQQHMQLLKLTHL